ncbi:trigger factor [Candidatus Neomarinimicrobiota bacterium]
MKTHAYQIFKEQDFDKSILKFRGKIRMPGFRTGKVPKKVLIKQFLPNIEAEFIEQSFQKYYLLGLKEKNLLPVNQADVDNIHFHFEEPLTFTATFEIEPDLILPELRTKSLKVEKTNYISDDEDIRLTIEEMRTSHAEIRTVEDGSKTGHYIFADLQKLDSSGVAIIGDKLEKRYIKVGDGIFTGENEKKLLGLNRGSKSQILIPDESGTESLYEINVLNIEEQVLPDVDMDFVKLMKSELNTVEEWKQSVKEKIDISYANKSEETFERVLADALIEKVNPVYPPSMVESYLDRLIDDVKKGNPDAELDDQKVRDTYRTLAERNMKWYLIRKAIIKDQDVKITTQEIDTEIKRLQELSPEQSNEIKKYYKKPSSRTRLEDDLIEKKIIAYLEPFAKVKQVNVPTKSLRETLKKD